jgi:hypothetical protein
MRNKTPNQPAGKTQFHNGRQRARLIAGRRGIGSNDFISRGTPSVVLTAMMGPRPLAGSVASFALEVMENAEYVTEEK